MRLLHGITIAALCRRLLYAVGIQGDGEECHGGGGGGGSWPANPQSKINTE